MFKLISTEADISSEQYSNFVEKATAGYNDYLIRRIEETKAKIGKSSISILDIGTGTGNLLLQLARHPSFQKDHLVGIDFSPSMIEKARKGLVDSNLMGRIDFLLMDVHDLSFPKKCFDLIVGRSIVHHWANPVVAFREIHRVLTDEGQVLINEPSSEPSPEALVYFNRQRTQIGCVPMVLSDKFSPSQMRELLKQAELPNSSVDVGEGILSIGYEVCIQKTA